MKIRTLFPLLALLVPVLKAETLVVLSGNSIQEKIDAASDGDIIAIFGGTYSQDVIINKRIRLVELAGQDVHISGNVTFDSVENCPPFEGFKVGSSSKGIKVLGTTPTTGLVIRDVETVLSSSGINTDGNANEVTVVGGVHSKISHSGGSLVVNSATVQGSFNVGGSAKKNIAFRTIVNGGCVWGGSEAELWLGYSETNGVIFSGSRSNLVIVGSKLSPFPRQGSYKDPCLRIDNNNNNITVLNSHLRHQINTFYDVNDIRCKAIFINGEGHEGVIRNNYFNVNRPYSTSSGATIVLKKSNQISITDNFFDYVYNDNSSSALIYAPFGTTFNNNMIQIKSPSGVTTVAGGLTDFETSFVGRDESLFIDDDPYRAKSDSPLINAGSPDPRYNDLDGSRNDIGPSGGSWYDPEGWTTENPVVISFDLSPDQVLGGVNDEVEISEIQAISAP